MRIVLSLLFFIGIILGMDHQEKRTPLHTQDPETLAMELYALSLESPNNQNPDELAVQMHSLNLHNNWYENPKSKFEKIVILAQKLNICLLKDASYHREVESILREYFPINNPDAGIRITPKSELYKPTRELLRTIIRASKNPSPNVQLLAETINQICSFKLKYTLDTQTLPMVIEDTTGRYKQEMLLALHS